MKETTRKYTINEIVDENGKTKLGIENKGFNDMEIIGFLTLIREHVVSVKLKESQGNL